MEVEKIEGMFINVMWQDMWDKLSVTLVNLLCAEAHCDFRSKIIVHTYTKRKQ